MTQSLKQNILFIFQSDFANYLILDLLNQWLLFYVFGPFSSGQKDHLKWQDRYTQRLMRKTPMTMSKARIPAIWHINYDEYKMKEKHNEQGSDLKALKIKGKRAISP